MLALHGSMGNAERMRRATGYGFERLADRHGFVAAFPQPYARFPRILGRTHAALDGPAEIWRFFARQAVS